MFDLPSPLPLLPLSLGFGCGEVSLSLMTVGWLPARPPLCPQLAQLSRGTKGQGSGGRGSHRLTHSAKTNHKKTFFSTDCCVAGDKHLKFSKTLSPAISYVYSFLQYSSLWSKEHTVNMHIQFHNAHYFIYIYIYFPRKNMDWKGKKMTTR